MTEPSSSSSEVVKTAATVGEGQGGTERKDSDAEFLSLFRKQQVPVSFYSANRDSEASLGTQAENAHWNVAYDDMHRRTAPVEELRDSLGPLPESLTEYTFPQPPIPTNFSEQADDTGSRVVSSSGVGIEDFYEKEVFNPVNNKQEQKGGRDSDILMPPSAHSKPEPPPVPQRPWLLDGLHKASLEFQRPFIQLEGEEEARCCGCARMLCIAITSAVLLALAVLGFFLWPRLPSLRLNSISTVGGEGFHFQNNEGTWALNLAANVSVDNGNYIAWELNKVECQLLDRFTGKVLGTGELTSQSLPPRGLSNLRIPVVAKYKTANLTDPTLRDLVAACSDARPALPIRWIMQVDVAGLGLFVKPSVELEGMWKCPSNVTVNDPLLA